MASSSFLFRLPGVISATSCHSSGSFLLRRFQRLLLPPPAILAPSFGYQWLLLRRFQRLLRLPAASLSSSVDSIGSSFVLRRFQQLLPPPATSSSLEIVMDHL